MDQEAMTSTLPEGEELLNGHDVLESTEPSSKRSRTQAPITVIPVAPTPVDTSKVLVSAFNRDSMVLSHEGAIAVSCEGFIGKIRYTQCLLVVHLIHSDLKFQFLVTPTPALTV